MKELTVTLFSLITFMSFGQNDQQSNVHKNRLKVSSVGMNYNNLIIFNRSSDFEELREIAENNTDFFPSNLNGYSSSAYPESFSFQIGVSLGFSPYNSKIEAYNNKRELTLRISYNYNYRRSFYFYKQTIIPADTFVSSNGVIYSDTLISSSYDYTEIIDELAINITYLYKTDPEKRISLYTGYGIGIGFSIYSVIKASNSEDTTLILIYGSNSYSNNGYGYYNFGSDIKKDIKTKPSIFIRPYIPFGLSFRLSKKRDILNQIHIFVQTKFGLEFQQIIGNNNSIIPFAGGGIGFKYNF